MNYFEFFSLPLKLHIDVPALEKQFYVLSRKLHPDRFAGKSPVEQEAALAESSLLNDAYRTLKDPIARTQYLLTLEGVQLEEQSKSATDAARATGEQKKQIVPPELLEEVFELNMQLAEMRANKQMGEDEPELRRELMTAKDAFDEKMVQAQEDLEALWTKWDSALEVHDEAAKLSARDGMVVLLNKRSYLRNLVRDVNEALE
ncbi:molecular chaperone HscB [Granulicella aggregans]|uniref:Molecular chaperone HscB n=1 Tax=Granulicella aggregans TaxID=474949 RepID=A0A7W7ZCF1_9BACT|nr:Fe-S protein assembly co-chaperone HscB [Granulicella aggregans]MBB5056801.1 molecular chaperone HscB [Granulicella aggregans]